MRHGITVRPQRESQNEIARSRAFKSRILAISNPTLAAKATLNQPLTPCSQATSLRPSGQTESRTPSPPIRRLAVERSTPVKRFCIDKVGTTAICFTAALFSRSSLRWTSCPMKFLVDLADKETVHAALDAERPCAILSA